MDAIDKAVQAAHDATANLAAHPNDKARMKARTMALVAVVNACDGNQTLATQAMGYKDRQLVNRQVRRAIKRGWAAWETLAGKPCLVIDVELPGQMEFAETVAMEYHPAGKPPILPPLSLGDPYAY